MVPRDEAMKAAFAVLSRNQDEVPELQVAAMAILFAAWCRRLKLEPSAMHLLGLRLIEPEAFHQKGNIHAETIRDFAGMRIAGDERVDVR
jgi:hypothetical protein